MNYFKGCNTEDERKKRYKELCKKHHPDLGGDAEVFKEVGRQYAEGENFGGFDGFYETASSQWGGRVYEWYQEVHDPRQGYDLKEQIRRAQKAAEEARRRFEKEKQRRQEEARSAWGTAENVDSAMHTIDELDPPYLRSALRRILNRASWTGEEIDRARREQRVGERG